MSQYTIPVGLDSVVAGYPLPPGGVLNAIHLEQHVLGQDGVQFQRASMYGTTGFVIPVLDPDGGATYNAIWDAQVPKDVALTAGAFDLDTAGADTTAEFEFGLPSLGGLMDLANGRTREIFRRRKLLSGAVGVGKPVADGNDEVFMADFYKTQVRPSMKVNCPSVVLFGTSSPDTLNTSGTLKAIPSEAEWMLLTYLETALENAFMSLAGLTESGAESPYEESLAFIAELVEDSVYEEDATTFHPMEWCVFTKATFDISVPGKVNLGTVTSE